MNDESAPHKTPSVDIEYQATKFEVCQTCHDEQKTLANEIDQLTLDKERPELRKKFLQAHLTKLNFENPAETAQIIFSYEAKRQTLEPNFDAQNSLPENYEGSWIEAPNYLRQILNKNHLPKIWSTIKIQRRITKNVSRRSKPTKILTSKLFEH